jgi:hypothetical protein
VACFAATPASASAQTAPADAPSARESDDGVPVDIRSAGRPQTVELTPLSDPSVPIRCFTPCELSLWPDRYQLTASARGIRRFSGVVEVPETGRTFLLRAPSKGGFVTGIVLTASGGIWLLVFGGLAGSALWSAPKDPSNQMYAAIAGGVVLFLAVPSLVAGIVLVNQHRPGLVTTARDANTPTIRLGAVPLERGALGAMSVRF